MRLKILAACVIAIAAAGAVAVAAEPSPADAVLDAARLNSFQVREGHYDRAAASVALLEPAVAAAPTDARLWNALGVAYAQQVSASLRAGAFGELPGLLRKVAAAHAKALEIAPADPEALVSLGATQAIMASFTGEAGQAADGVAKMNRAVALAPDAPVVRLQRAFTNLGIPARLRDSAAAEQDLLWLIRIADGGKPGDVLHVLLGDLYAETGKTALATAQYETSARPASATRALAAARLTALGAGGVPLSDMSRLRADLGRNCAMCHGS